MAGITIVGLGPGAPELLTRAAWQILSDASEIWLRTLHHPVVAALPPDLTLHSFDALYEKADTFAEVYAGIVARILELGARPEGVLYAVPGHPLVGEAAAQQLLTAAREQGLPVRLVAGLSFVEPLLSALGVDALDGLQLVDALDLTLVHHPPLDPDLPAIIAQVYSRGVASDLKLTLMHQYADEQPVALVDAAGTAAERVVWLPLYELDRHDVGPLTSLYVPALPRVSGFAGLQETIARLRAPDGCPWDREQTHESLRSNLLEETYEVLDAIDDGDPDHLCEELGDLLLQIVLHTQIAVEDEHFRMADVIAGIDAKLKHRHPHVWGSVAVADAEEVGHNWETIKHEDRVANGEAQRSVLASIPLALPALAQAAAYSSRAQRLGFDWPEISGVVDKVHEELAELAAAPDAPARFAELGDLLFAVVNWARWLDIDPESALREANARFARRFAYLEAQARTRGTPLNVLSIEELEAWWDAAKATEG